MTEIPQVQEYQDSLIALPALLTITPDQTTPAILTDVTFRRCTLLGPAVLYFFTQTPFTISGCSFDGELEAVLWPLGPGRTQIVGALPCSGVNFIDCRLMGIGIAADDVLAEHIRKGTVA